MNYLRGARIIWHKKMMSKSHESTYAKFKSEPKINLVLHPSHLSANIL